MKLSLALTYRKRIFHFFRNYWTLLKYRLPKQHRKSFDNILNDLLCECRLEDARDFTQFIFGLFVVTKILNSELSSYLKDIHTVTMRQKFAEYTTIIAGIIASVWAILSMLDFFGVL